MGHHYVPREYLRGFADPTSPDVLWQFDKTTQSISTKLLPIEIIAQSRNFYDTATEEQLHRLVEVPGNGVLRKLRSGNLVLEDNEKAALATYIHCI